MESVVAVLRAEVISPHISLSLAARPRKAPSDSKDDSIKSESDLSWDFRKFSSPQRETSFIQDQDQIDKKK